MEKECECYEEEVQPYRKTDYKSIIYRLLVYCAGSGVNRVQVVLSGFSVRLLCLSRQKLYVGMVVCIY